LTDSEWKASFSLFNDLDLPTDKLRDLVEAGDPITDPALLCRKRPPRSLEGETLDEFGEKL